jgi:sugar lactone lactonase YvrE
MRFSRLALMLLMTLTMLAGGVTAPAAAQRFPEVVPLPDGFQPEGISTGRGASFYVGSLADGAIYRGDLRTGEGSVLVEGDGDPAVGTEVDRRNRLWVAGGPSGTARVYDARSGELIREYTFGGAGFVNDVVVTKRAAYFTDSFSDRLYVVPVGPGGRLGDAESRTLSGDFVLVPGDFNANGIEASPNGRTLLVVQSATGLLFAVDAATGEATEVDLGGELLTSGDGLLRQGRTLYVVQNFLNQIAVVRLGAGYETGTLVRTLTDEDFRVPTTVARWGSSLYAVNARFDTPPTPDTEYDVVRVDPR